MRVLCIAVIALGYVAAFVPSLYPSTTARRSNYSSKQLQAKQKPQRCDVLLRTTAAAAASADFDEQTEEQGLRAGGTEGGKEPTIGVIVCDHGSRRENANDMLFEVAERYRSFAGCDIVEAAHMELAKPSIDDAFDRCVAAGAQKVVLHPFFLSPGRHVTSDIPALMSAAAKRHPKTAWVISEPLGLQELMPRVMHAAVSESVTEGTWRYGGGGDGSEEGGM